MKKLLLGLIAVLAVALVPVAVTATPASAAARADGEMGTAEAGRYYASNACRLEASGDHFFQVVWKGRQRITAPEVKRRLPELRRESRRYATAQLRWASALYNPPAPWPSVIDSQVNRLAAINVRYADFRNRQGYADTAQQWLNLNGRANQVDFGHYPAQIRAHLGLPPSGQGCP